MNTEQATEALLSRAAAGDDAALEALLEAVQPQLYRFSMKMCRHSADAEDVLQDSLLAAARSIRTFRGDATLSTWLFTIARRSCIKERRKRAGALVFVACMLAGMAAHRVWSARRATCSS